MRRDELIKALSNVVFAITETGLYKIIQTLTRTTSGAKKEPIDQVLSAYGKFVIRSNEFGSVEKQVMQTFGLSRVQDSTFWTEALGEGRSPIAMDVRMRMSHFIEDVPKLIALLTRESESREIVIEEKKKKGATSITTKRLTLLIRESSTPNLTVRAFAEILGTIETLYSAIVKIEELDNAELIVGTLDSGSDKSLDIIGIATGIAKLSDLLLQAWDRVRFAQASKASAGIKVALEGLSLLEKLKTATDNGVIVKEESEKLRRTVVNSIHNLFAGGVYTPEMEAQPVLRPSQIEVERRKLIAHYSKPTAPVEAEVEVEADDEEESGPDA